MRTTIRRRVSDALRICLRDYRRAELDCPLAAGIVAVRRRRARAGRHGRRGWGAVLDDAARVDRIYLEAAAGCRTCDFAACQRNALWSPPCAALRDGLARAAEVR